MRGLKNPISSVNILEVTVFAGLAAAIFLPQYNIFSSLNMSRLILGFILIILATAFIVLRSNALIFPRWKQSLIVLPFLCYLILKILFGQNNQNSILGNSGRQLGLLNFLACFFYFTTGMVLMANVKNSVIRVVSLLFSFEIIFIAINFLHSPVNAQAGSFYNTNFSSVFLSFTSIIITIKYFESKDKSTISIVKLFFFCVFSILILIWNGSVQGLVGYLIPLVIYFLQWRFKILRKFPSLISFICLIIFLIFLLFVILSDLPSVGKINANSFYERLEIYKTAVRVLAQHPFFGIGIDNFNLGYFKLNFSNNLKLVDNAHSIPMHLLATVGLVGFVSWLFIFFRVLSSKVSIEDPLKLPLQFGVFSYLVSGFFAIQNPGTEFLVFLICGACQSAGYSKSNYSKFMKIGILSSLLIMTIYVIHSFAIYEKQTQILTDYGINQAFNQSSIFILEKSLKDVYDLGLLLNEAELSMGIGDKEFGLKVMQRMLNIAPQDQRTIAVVLKLSDRWSDSTLANIGANLEAEAQGALP